MFSLIKDMLLAKISFRWRAFWFFLINVSICILTFCLPSVFSPVCANCYSKFRESSCAYLPLQVGSVRCKRNCCARAESACWTQLSVDQDFNVDVSISSTIDRKCFWDENYELSTRYCEEHTLITFLFTVKFARTSAKRHLKHGKSLLDYVELNEDFISRSFFSFASFSIHRERNTWRFIYGTWSLLIEVKFMQENRGPVDPIFNNKCD